MNKAIQVWRWEDAPEHLKKLSDNGGDEDWVALVPFGLDESYIPWLEEGHFGNGVQVVETTEGVVYISSHA